MLVFLSRQSARDFVFGMLDSGYVKYGVRNFWFDASEPESLANAKLKWRTFDNPLGQPQGSTYSTGTNQQVGMIAYVNVHLSLVFIVYG